MIGLLWFPLSQTLIDLREWDLYTEANLCAAWRARPWYRRCSFCTLDEGGEHFSGCPWWALVETWAAGEHWAAVDAADAEQTRRTNDWLRRESEEYVYGD